MLETIIHDVLSALLIAILIWIGQQLKNWRKKSENNIRLLTMKVESIDFGLANMDGEETNKVTSAAYKIKRDARWKQLIDEHEVQVEGLK